MAPLLRRALDRVLIRPVARRMEKRVLRAGRILALSEYTRRELDRLAGSEIVSAVLPMPIDGSLFRPQRARVEPGLIGFVGRFDDARKNAGLFVDALALMVRSGVSVRGLLLGGRPKESLLKRAREQGVLDRLQFLDMLPRAEIAEILATLDVFVIPSHQEGLCIAGLEAMAMGCPVVSTRCGGPEEYVIDGENGYLTGFDPEQISNAVSRIVVNRELRGELSLGAEQMITRKYSFASAESLFWSEFGKAFSDGMECRRS